MNAPTPLSLPRTVALVGLMGAGKSAIGRRLAHRLGLPFVDADDEIERAAGCTISEFFERFGEIEFRSAGSSPACSKARRTCCRPAAAPTSMPPRAR
jgi:hypothetical protein